MERIGGLKTDVQDKDSEIIDLQLTIHQKNK